MHQKSLKKSLKGVVLFNTTLTLNNTIVVLFNTNLYISRVLKVLNSVK